jgi:hypothetical protein
MAGRYIFWDRGSELSSHSLLSFQFFLGEWGKERALICVRSKPSEIAKRAAIFTAVGQVGSMFAGIMMTAMHKTLEGKGGLKGWQWVFLIGMLYAS